MNRSAGSVALPRVDPPHPAASSPSAVAAASHPIAIDLVGFQRAKPSHTSHTGLPTPSSLPAQPVRSHQCAVQPPQLPPYRPSDSGGSVQPQVIAVDARSRSRSRSRPRAAVTAAATATTATTADDNVTRRNGAAARPAAPTTPPSSSDESTIDDDLASLPGALFVMEDLELASTSSSSSSSMPHPLDRAQPSPAAPPSSGSPGARAAPVTMAPRTFGWAPNGPAATYERLTGPDRSSGSTTRVSADATSPPATSSSTLSSSYPYPSPRSAPTPSAFSSNIVIRRTHRARYSQHVEPAPASMQVQVTPSRGRHPAAIPLATSDVASRPATPSISVKRAYDEVSPTTGSTPPAMPVDAEMHDADDDSAAPGRSPSPFSGSDDSANMAPLPAWHTCESQRASVSGRSSTFSLDSSRTGRNSPATLRRRSPISASISSVRPASTVTSGHAYLDPYDEVGLDRLGISRDRSKRRRSATIPHSEGSERSSPSTSTAPATSGTAGTTFAPALGRYVPRPIPIDPVLVAEPWPAPPSLNVRGAAAASPASSTLASSSSQTMSFREELESQFSNLRPSVTLSMPSSTIPTIAARTPATDASSSEPSSRRSVGGFTRFWQAGNPTGPISSNASAMATSSAVTIPVTAGARDWSTTPPMLSLRTRAARSSTFPQTLPSSTAPSQVMDYRWMVDGLSSTRAHVADSPDSTTTNAREVLQRATERLERAEATMSRVLGATTPSTLEERILARRQSRLNFHLSPPAGTESSGEDTEMNLNQTTRAASEGIWASSPSDGEGSSSGGGSTTAPASANPPTTTTSRTRYFLTNLRARRPRLARNSTGVPSPEVMSSERERSGWLDDLHDEGAVSTSQVSVVAPALWGEEQSQSPQRLDVAHAGAIDSAPSSMAPRRMRGPTERANERWRLGQAPVTAQTTTTNVTASATGLNTPSLVRESSYRLGPRSSTTHTLGQRAAVATEGPTRTLPWRSMDFRSTTTAPRTTENGTSGGDLASEIRRRYNTLREADSTIPTPVRRPVDPEVTPWEDARSSDLSEDSTVSGGSTLPRPERVAPFALTPRLAPPRYRPARGLDLSSMTPSLDSGNDSREVEALEARAAAALRPSALPPMLSSGSRGRRPTHGSNETRPDDLPRFDPFGSDAVDIATGSRSNRPALLAAMRASSQLAQGTIAHRSRTSLAEALTRYDAARLADEREQDDLRQRRAEEGAIDDTARRYVIEETEWEREDDDDDDPGSDVDMELWRPDVRRTFGEEVAAGRSRWVRAEMEASAESEQRARQAQERMRSRSEALAALRRDRGQMRHLMGNLTAPLTSGLSGPSITRTTTTTTTTSASPPTSTTTVNTASVGAARDAGDQATPRSPGTRRRGLSDFFRGVGATAHFGTSLFDDDSLLAFFGRDSVALDPRNYLADDLFDSSYDALLRLSEQLGDVVKPKGVPEDKLAALRTFKYKAWPIPERRDASNSPSMTTTISTVPVASTSTSRPFGSTMVDPVIVPALARKGLEKEERCSVCLMDYDDDDECMLGMCAHGFHRECLLAWLKEHGTCP
ncbi:BZ3500_MvSof-1268-A1-R1_Chr4-2g06996 [Microbotryum saponariae]|uniref:BZ3500_MvSof-1268-A1-R1_Chr4-2g06996 protein n=1 Tax=Microbotryum saponariae TaxID=289078 RepID=A0A2X0KSN9_9BASI|nr:BZ3500_MvSof-1268-A1-R1_Chr4-2g06996 [Microbotryum saponariae]SDA06661.1 BZ3501_MvSof-1269-A2-R1_Chr4-2g06707 [Microbotryum saponariae]